MLGQNNILETFVTNYLEINKTKNNIFKTIRILIYLSICIIFEFKIFGLIIANISYLLINIYKNLHFIRINMLKGNFISINIIDKEFRSFLINIFPKRNLTLLFIIFGLICYLLSKKHDEILIYGSFLMLI